MTRGKPELLENVGHPFSSSSCLICHKRIKAETIIASQKSENDDSMEMLKKIACILDVSPTIYQEVDLADIPVRLLCSSCNETIVDAVQLQEAMKTLQNQLKRLVRIIKRDIIQSFHVDTMKKAEDTTGGEYGQVELIRKTYAQCWTTCEIKLPLCDISPGQWQSSSRGLSDDYDCLPSFPVISDEEPLDYDSEARELNADWDPTIVKSESSGIWEESSQSQEALESEMRPDLKINQIRGSSGNLPKYSRRKPAQRKRFGSTPLERSENSSLPVTDSRKSGGREYLLNYNSKNDCNINVSTNTQVNFVSQSSIPKKILTVRKTVKCDRCGRIFTKMSSLKKHLVKKKPCKNLNLHSNDDPLGQAEDVINAESELTLSEYKNEPLYENENGDEESCDNEYQDPFDDNKLSTNVNSLNNISKTIRNNDQDPLGLDFPPGESSSSKTCFSLNINTLVEPSPFPFKCPTCDKKFTSDPQMQAHIRMNHMKIMCKSCGEYFSCRKNLMSHRRKVHGFVYTNKRVRESTFKCELCDKSYTKRTHLRAHINHKHHGIPKSFPCPNCNEIFSCRSIYYKHINEGHKPKPHIECTLCGENMPVEKLPQHLELHDGNPDFPCPFCPAKLQTERALSCHLSKSHGQGPSSTSVTSTILPT